MLLLVTITVMLSATAIPTIALNNTGDILEKNQTTPQFTFNRIVDRAPQMRTAKLPTCNQNNMATIGTDLLVYGMEDLEVKNPSITDNGGLNVLVAMEGWIDLFMPPNPYFRWSTDGGNSWLPEDSAIFWDLSSVGYDSMKPDFDFSGGSSAFGTILPFGQTDWMTFNFPDITDDAAEDGWAANGWLASAMMEEWDSADACGVSSLYTPSDGAYGICIWTGDTLDGIDNGLYYGWEIVENNEFTVYPGEELIEFDFEADQAKNDVDLSSGKYYQAFYRFNDVSEENLADGVYIRGAQLDGTSDWADTWTITHHIEGAEFPDVKADGGNCYVVYEINGGIGCSYSNDDGDTFTEVIVANNGANPSISAIGETVIASYTRGGNLYTSISEDGGQTWMEGAPVNDDSGTVLEEDSFNSAVSGMYAVWTDEKLGYQAVFFDKAEVAVPIIEIDTISGGLGVSAVVKNTGLADASDISWSINLNGGAFVGADTTGTIDNLPAGETVTISSNFIIGIGATEITVTAGSASSRASGTVFLFFVLGL